MKKIVTLGFLLISLITHGQNKIIIKDDPNLFAPTAIGEPDGEKTSKEIGKAGGNLISSDEKVELIIPAGALTSNIKVSIQPITSLTQDGSGKAFRLEPSGINFLQPVQLVFHYTDKEMEEGSPQLMGIAFQDEKGFWYGIRNFKLDTVAKTITGNITHFSDWKEKWLITLTPEKNRVKVSHEINIFLGAAHMEKESRVPGVNARMNPFMPEFNTKKNWSVNDIPDGNNTVGIIHIVDGAGPTVVSRIYKAPAQVPDQNTVEIAVELSNIKPDGADSMNYPYQENLIRKCKVRVYDNEYDVSMESSMDGNAGSVLGKVTYKDNGSFTVSLDGKEPKILDVKNNNDSWNYFGKCTVERKYSGRGLINIAGTRSIKITPANPPQQAFAIVDIIFAPSKIDPTVLLFMCPDRKGGTTTIASVFAMSFLQSAPALPIRITFPVKEGEQELPGTINVEGMYYKVKVKQIKDDN